LANIPAVSAPFFSMHATHLLIVGAALAAFGWFAASTGGPSVPGQPPLPVAQPLPEPPQPNGHFALVVEGDRDRLAITHANGKAAPWAGVPKGFTSAWRLTVLGAGGQILAEVPLDVSAFDVSADRKGGPVQVTGCIVRDPRIVMLVNAPRFAEAAVYTFDRMDGDGVRTEIGRVDGNRVRVLAGGGR